jgi:acetoin utilization protein AcuB
MQRIHEVMGSGPLVTITPRAFVSEALRLIGERDVSHLLVMRGAKLLGITCICDLDCAQGDKTVGACMQPPLVIDADASVGEAARSMIDRGVSCLPVVTPSGRVEGIVTASDLRRSGMLQKTPERCAACGSDDHVRALHHPLGVGFCIECTRRAAPPTWADDLGGGD